VADLPGRRRVYKEVSGDKLSGPPTARPRLSACAFTRSKAACSRAKWYPWYINGDPNNVGTENLKGPENLEGDFTITAAKAPATGAPYSGTVSIKPKTVVGAGDWAKPYDVVWTLGTLKIYGIGIRTGNFLFVATGSGVDTNIARYQIGNGTMEQRLVQAGLRRDGRRRGNALSLIGSPGWKMTWSRVATNGW